MLPGRRTFLVKERVAIVKRTDAYDILDPESGRPLGEAREEPPAWAKSLRLVVAKQLLPTAVNVYEADRPEGPPALSIRKGTSIFRKKLDVVGADGASLGRFESKIVSLGGGFHVYDAAGARVAEVKGDWKGWNFRLLRDGREVGTVTKKWAGIGKELFTSADTYIIALTDEVDSPEEDASLLAAGLSIDIVFKEGR